MQSETLLALITVPSFEVGETIAESLVERKLAACVNILPSISSIYSWKGEIQKDEELLLLVKTKMEGFKSRFIPAVIKLHPYELPEIIAIPIVAGSKEYIQWILSQTNK